jgi:hypothetical protein
MAEVFCQRGLGGYRVCGFVSGHYEENADVVLGGKQTDYNTAQNSGLIQIASVNEVLTIIKNNPVGPIAKSD